MLADRDRRRLAAGTACPLAVSRAVWVPEQRLAGKAAAAILSNKAILDPTFSSLVHRLPDAWCLRGLEAAALTWSPFQGLKNSHATQYHLLDRA
jgi:hypothetical protein